MPFIANHFVIGTAAVKVVTEAASPQKVSVHNHEHSNKDIYIGGPGVTILNGLHIPDTQTLHFDVPAGEQVWAISDTTDNELHVLVTGH
jgi:hypothetical protein